MWPARSGFSYSFETEEIKESLGLATAFLLLSGRILQTLSWLNVPLPLLPVLAGAASQASQNLQLCKGLKTENSVFFFGTGSKKGGATECSGDLLKNWLNMLVPVFAVFFFFVSVFSFTDFLLSDFSNKQLLTLAALLGGPPWSTRLTGIHYNDFIS